MRTGCRDIYYNIGDTNDESRVLLRGVIILNMGVFK